MQYTLVKAMKHNKKLIPRIMIYTISAVGRYASLWNAQAKYYV